MTFIKQLAVSFSLRALAAAPAYAADEKKSETKAAAGATAKTKSFAELDTNKDGSVSRAEVAAHAELAAKFKDADKNNDGKLSRSEYDAMAKAGGDAAAGATAKKEDKKPAKQ
ncbi:MAG: hypothetical protein ACT4P3_18680 [Betaproteobacteria bacterium]